MTDIVKRQNRTQRRAVTSANAAWDSVETNAKKRLKFAHRILVLTEAIVNQTAPMNTFAVAIQVSEV